MSSDCDILSCDVCDYTSKWKYNLSRHMMRKHAQQNVNPLQQNVNPLQQNVNPLQQNVNPDEHIPFECELCNKIFTKQWILNRHKKICNGINDALTCIYCKKIFASRQSKYKHNKKLIIETLKLIIK